MAFCSGRSAAAAVEAAAPPLALLAVGACEQHGPHLPLETDTLIAGWIAERVGRELGAFVPPPVPYGTSVEHSGFPGTLALRPETLAAVLRDLVESCLRFGIRRVAIVSGHGGNFILRPAVRHLNAALPEARVILVPEPLIWGEAFEAGDLHAGRVETSIVLHLHPEAVGEPPADFVPAAGREYLDYVSLRRLSASGIWGRPRQASREEGQAVLEQIARRVAGYITQTFRELETIREGTY